MRKCLIRQRIKPCYSKKPRLLEQVQQAIRRLHYSRRTEEAYVEWVKKFIYWSGKRRPVMRGASEVSAFLSRLATERNVAAEPCAALWTRTSSARSLISVRQTLQPRQ